MTKTQASTDAAGTILKQCREKVLANLPAITQAMIDQAADGSCPHAKFLFDLIDAAPAKENNNDLPGPSLAEILMERLKLVSPDDPAAQAPPDSEACA